MDKLNFFRNKNGTILLSKSDVQKILIQRGDKNLNPRVVSLEQDGVEFVLGEVEGFNYALVKKHYETPKELITETYSILNGCLKSVYAHNFSLNQCIIENYNATGQVTEIHTTKEKGLGSCRISCEVKGKKVFEREDIRNDQGKLVKVKLQRDGLQIEFDLTQKQAPFTLKNFARLCLGLTPTPPPQVVRHCHNSSFGS